MDTSTISLIYVEDDERLGALTRTYLEKHGVQVHLVTSGELALERLEHMTPDAILLDVMLPGIDGRAVCQRIRQTLDVPILMVSALDEEVDRILGLEDGADDYITKPFSSRELLARIHAQVRRSRGALVPQGTRQLVGPLMLDPTTLEVTLDDQPLELTSHEFALLHALAQRPGRVLSREQLMLMARGRNDEVFDRAIDVQISRLRQKLGEDPRHPNLIKTVRGIGYMLTIPRP